MGGRPGETCRAAEEPAVPPGHRVTALPHAPLLGGSVIGKDRRMQIHYVTITKLPDFLSCYPAPPALLAQAAGLLFLRADSVRIRGNGFRIKHDRFRLNSKKELFPGRWAGTGTWKLWLPLDP